LRNSCASLVRSCSFILLQMGELLYDLYRLLECAFPCKASTRHCEHEIVTCKNNIAKVIWEDGRIVGLSHAYTIKSSLATIVHPKFAPKSTPSSGPIPKPHNSTHPWTCLTYDAKWRPDLIAIFPQCTG